MLEGIIIAVLVTAPLYGIHKAVEGVKKVGHVITRPLHHKKVAPQSWKRPQRAENPWAR